MIILHFIWGNFCLIIFLWFFLPVISRCQQGIVSSIWVRWNNYPFMFSNLESMFSNSAIQCEAKASIVLFALIFKSFEYLRTPTNNCCHCLAFHLLLQRILWELCAVIDPWVEPVFLTLAALLRLSSLAERSILAFAACVDVHFVLYSASAFYT